MSTFVWSSEQCREARADVYKLWRDGELTEEQFLERQRAIDEQELNRVTHEPELGYVNELEDLDV